MTDSTKTKAGAEFRAMLVEALDDISAAVDAMSIGLAKIESDVLNLNDRLESLERNLSEIAAGVESLESLPIDVTARLEEAGFLADAQELTDALNRKERLEMLESARAAKGRMALITFR